MDAAQSTTDIKYSSQFEGQEKRLLSARDKTGQIDLHKFLKQLKVARAFSRLTRYRKSKETRDVPGSRFIMRNVV